MLLQICFLFAGSFCCCSGQIHNVVNVLQNTRATLACPDGTRDDVTWSRLRGGVEVPLVTIKKGKVDLTESRFGSGADSSLLIHSVQDTDSGMYFCNTKKVYLNVTTDPNMVRPDQNGEPTAGGTDKEAQQLPDLWKIPVGVVIGAALVLLAALALRACSKHTDTRTSEARRGAEVIYEEIEDKPDVESPYNWSGIIQTQDTPTPPNTNTYSSVNKQETKSPWTECVYSFVQNPAEAGSISQ